MCPLTRGAPVSPTEIDIGDNGPILLLDTLPSDNTPPYQVL